MSHSTKAIFFTIFIFVGIVAFFYRKPLIEKFYTVFFTEVYEKETAEKENPKSQKPGEKKKKSKKKNIIAPTSKNTDPNETPVLTEIPKSSGTIIDEYNGVEVYYNGNVRSVHGRHVTPDGYNLGLKYQCVEYVKRYYYQVLGHKMPNSYGDAKDYFDFGISDGGYNSKRGLTQCSNPSNQKPRVHDLLIYGPNVFNSFGHVAIVTGVEENQVHCVAQNLGPGNGTRRSYDLSKSNGQYHIVEEDIIGWLRK